MSVFLQFNGCFHVTVHSVVFKFAMTTASGVPHLDATITITITTITRTHLIQLLVINPLCAVEHCRLIEILVCLLVIITVQVQAPLINVKAKELVTFSVMNLGHAY